MELKEEIEELTKALKIAIEALSEIAQINPMLKVTTKHIAQTALDDINNIVRID